jgi:hypothetical protein
MKKLNTRQIIILAIAALCVLYAAYEFLIAGPSAKKVKTETNPIQIASFVNTLSNDLMKNKIVGSDAYIAKIAEKDWGKSPFWERASYREFVGNEAGSGVAKIIYSGYVDTGRKKMAIINGWEYELGESIDIEGYVLKSVTPSSVLIVNRNTGGELNISIQE